jgi:hypothetical protein
LKAGLLDPRNDVSLAIRPKPNAFEDEEEKRSFFKVTEEKLLPAKIISILRRGCTPLFNHHKGRVLNEIKRYCNQNGIYLSAKS